MTIERFIINNQSNTLNLLPKQAKHQLKSKTESYSLPFEYLRISSPLNKPKNSQTIVSHKKQVQLIAIESVAKHGYRLIFDDHHSAIYSADYLLTLAVEQEARWSDYLDKLKESSHSREAMIEIKQVT